MIPRSVLVTGGAGFIGSAFVRECLAAWPGCRVVNLDLLTYAGSLDNLAAARGDPRHHFVHGDIGDAGLVRALMAEHGIDAVVNLAAESHVDRSISGPQDFVRTNVLGTTTLLDAARAAWADRYALDPAVCRFHQVSTDEVYGPSALDEAPVAEGARTRPTSPYAASKAAADHLVGAWHRTYGLPVTLTHACNTYGPMQHPEKLVPTVVRQARSGAPIPVYGDGRNRRSWLHVSDHCRGIRLAVEAGRPGEAYNLGPGTERENLDLVREIAGLLDALRPEGAPHERWITFVSDRPGHDLRYGMDCTKARTELGYRPQVPLTDGLLETVAALCARDAP